MPGHRAFRIAAVVALLSFALHLDDATAQRVFHEDAKSAESFAGQASAFGFRVAIDGRLVVTWAPVIDKSEANQRSDTGVSEHVGANPAVARGADHVDTNEVNGWATHVLTLDLKMDGHS